MLSVRVLIIGINYSPEPTGIAPYTTGIADGLSERGFDVQVITTLPHYPGWSVFPGWVAGSHTSEGNGASVRRVRHYVPSRPTALRRVLSEISFGLKAISLPWSSPDVVLVISPALLSASIVLKRCAYSAISPATGVVAQDLYSAGSGEIGGYPGFVTSGLGIIESRVFKSADGVASIHSRLKQRIVQDLMVTADDISVIRNWTHIQSKESGDDVAEGVRKALGWKPGEFIVLHTGAMGEKQDLLNVVEAARLADDAQSSVRFVLVGDGSQKKSLEIAGRGIGSLSFLPPVDKEAYADLLAAADLLLVHERSGLSEMALPSKLTSYFSAGRPVLAITNRLSTTAEEVLGSGAGVVGPQASAGDLLRLVHELAAEPDRLKAMGEKGPIYCRTTLSARRSLDAYADWATSLVAKRANRRRGRRR